MAAKAVIVNDQNGPVIDAEATFCSLDIDRTFPLTNKDGYTLSPLSLDSDSGVQYLKVFANGYKPYLQLISLDDNNQEVYVGGDPNFGPSNTIHLPPLDF